MLRITRDQVIYAMSADNEPAAYCESGDCVIFETNDCFGGQIQKETDRMGTIDWSKINPATGPLYIHGAEPGDVLKVEIREIKLASQGAMCEAPGEGVTGAAISEEATKIIPVEDGRFVFNDHLQFPISPMIGVIGTAPSDGKEINTGTPDSHGGNMDCNRIGENTVLYLPVNTKGALLAMGDMHARMGNGEVCVCGIEIAGEVLVEVTVLKKCAYPTPFLVHEKAAMTIYSDSTLDLAAAGATLRMRQFLVDEIGMDEHEAGFLLSAVGDVEICQCVDPNRTCRMEIPKYITDQYGYIWR